MTTEATKTIRILLIDDHTVVREGTREMLNSHPRLTVVGEADNGEDLHGLITLKQPDLLLLDINLPGKNGLKLLEEIRPRFPGLKIVMFSAHGDMPYIRKALELKADGYLSKTINKEQLQQSLIRALEQDTQNAPLFSEDIQQRLRQAGALAAQSQLTPREHEILLHVAQGSTNQQIADTLHVSVKTVDTHVGNLLKKLGMGKRAQLVAYAYEQGWV